MTGRYKAYPEYKDSGVNWLEKIPSHWKAIPLKLLVNTRKGVAFKSSDFSSAGTRVVKASDIKKLTINSSEVYLPHHFSSSYPNAVLRYGDIILSTVGSIPDVKNSAVGQIGIVPKQLDGALLNQNTVVFDSKPAYVDGSFLFKAIQMSGYRDHLDLNAHGTANQASLSISDMLDFYFAIPPIEEQQKIANFLDHETAKIDTLIAKQEKLIELLKEKRQAVISHAVTKGLNPDVPMKDSGVEWLGEVPEHWMVGALRWRISISSGEGLSSNLVEKSKTDVKQIPVIGGNGVMGYSETSNTDKTAIAIGRVGALCGNVHKIDFTSWITDNALKVSNWDGFDTNYLVSLLKAAKLNDLASKTAQPLITGEQIKALTVVVPPLEEQVAINQEIVKIETQFDSLEQKSTLGIKLLKERKTALISAAVTGKIDVRDWELQGVQG
ncbi:TPA: restriction endonuclease subunit S [Vibrio diabolicus]